MKYFDGAKSVHGLFSVVLLAGLVVSGVHPARGEGIPLQQQSTTLGFDQLSGGSLLIPVRVNDTDATFIVDLGSNRTCVSSDLVAKLHLIPQLEAEADGKQKMFQGKQEESVNVKKLTFGSFLMDDAPLIVIDKKQFYPMGKHVDGVLGTDILYSVAILFDFFKHQMTFFTPGGFANSDTKSLGFESPTILSMTQNSIRLYTIPSTVSNGKQKMDVDLLVDTGAETTGISPAIVKKLKLKRSDDKSYLTYYGWEHFLITTLPEIQLGSIQLSSKMAVYTEKDDDLLPPRLGIDILSGFLVLFDAPAKKLYLQPVSSSVSDASGSKAMPTAPSVMRK